jgi:hypothetical protein
MRTTGTFQTIYNAAKQYQTDPKGKPHNPVVRQDENGKWMLESGLEPAENAVFECPLETFDYWFDEAYKDDKYTPSDNDENDFKAGIER